jgi:hypothetical protein
MNQSMLSSFPKALRPLDPIELLCVFACGSHIAKWFLPFSL